MAKPFLSYEAQLNKLENEKALTISNRDYSMTMLQRIGYFSLIVGIKRHSRIQQITYTIGM